MTRRGVAEKSTIATIRTRWSVPGGCRDIRGWAQWQKRLHDQSVGYLAASGERETLLLVGDSITEEWRGTGCGRPRPEFVNMPAVLASRPFGPRWDGPTLLGISGDQTQHLLWRLTKGGELSAQMKDDPRLAVSLLIGTNNLGIGGMTADATAAGVAAVAELILTTTRARLMVNALHSRGDGRPDALKKLCPPLCNQAGHPLASFDGPVRRVNELVSASVTDMAARFPGRVRFSNCGEIFRNSSWRAGSSEARELVRLDLLPDRVHPGAAGQLAWAQCMAGKLSEWPRLF